MDKAEARALAEDTLAGLRSVPYDTLVGRYLDNLDHREVVGGSGARYHLQVEAFWDSGQPGDLRVTVTVDDGGWRAFVPLSTDFIIGADGTFIGE